MPLEHRLHARCGCASIGSAEHASAAAGRPFTFPPARATSSATARSPSTTSRSTSRSTSPHAEHSRARRRSTCGASIPRRTSSRSTRSASTSASVTVDGKPRRSGATTAARSASRIDAGARDRRASSSTYGATPRRGLYFLEPDEHYPTRPRQVWSQCQEEDARHWFPCHDSPHVKMTTEIVAHVPERLVRAVERRARLAAQRREAGDWTFHWKMSEPHPSYLVTLVAGEFAEMTDRCRSASARSRSRTSCPRGARRTGGARSRSTPRDDRALQRGHRRAVPVEQVRAGRRRATSSSAGWRTRPRRRCTSTSCSTSAPPSTSSSDDLDRPRARAPVVRRLRHVPRLVRGLAERGLRDLLRARLAREAPRARRVRLRPQGRPRRATSARRTAATGARSSVRTTTPRSICSTATSTRRAALVLHALRMELGDALFWRGVRALPRRATRAASSRRATCSAPWRR